MTKKTAKQADMEKEIEQNIEKNIRSKVENWGNGKSSGSGSGGVFYGLGFVGALVYYIQAADTLGDGLIGVGRAVIWPATVAYKLLELFYGAA